MKKLIVTLLSLGMCLSLFSIKNVNAYDNNTTKEFIDLIDRCMENKDSLVLSKDAKILSGKEVSTLENLYKEKNYGKIKEFLDDNMYNLAFTEDTGKVSPKGFSIKKQTVRTEHKSSKIQVGDHKVQGKWASLLTCEFGYNVNTYKVSKIYGVTLSLESYFVCPDTQLATLENVKTKNPVILSDGASIQISATYTVKAKNDGVPIQNVNFGTYTDKGVVKV